jgi:hypothetical protein
MRELDVDIDWEHEKKRALTELERACKLLYPNDPYSYKTKSSTSGGRSRGHPDLLNPDPHSRPDWANLHYQAMAAIELGILDATGVVKGESGLLYVQRGRGIKVELPKFLRWAQEEQGVTIPSQLAGIEFPSPPSGETQPSSPLAPDNEARPKAPTIFIAALIRLLVEISKRAAKNGRPFDVNEMPGTKADFREVAIRFDSKFIKAPSTIGDYLDGLLWFKRGARATTFYRELFPELFT